MSNYIIDGASERDKSKWDYRHHDIEFKRRLAMLCGETGASVSTIAREHDINANILLMWRRPFTVFQTEVRVVLAPVNIATKDVQAVISVRPSRAHTKKDRRIGLFGCTAVAYLDAIQLKSRTARDPCLQATSVQSHDRSRSCRSPDPDTWLQRVYALWLLSHP